MGVGLNLLEAFKEPVKCMYECASQNDSKGPQKQKKRRFCGGRNVGRYLHYTTVPPNRKLFGRTIVLSLASARIEKAKSRNAIKIGGIFQLTHYATPPEGE